MPDISRHQHSRALSLKPSDEVVLYWLHRFFYLTSTQLCRLAYSKGSLSLVQAKLKTLTDAGYVQRIWIPRRDPRGKATRDRDSARFGRSPGVPVKSMIRITNRRKVTQFRRPSCVRAVHDSVRRFAA